MAFDPTVPGQVNKLINDTVLAANNFLTIIDQLDNYVSLIDSNDVVNVLNTPNLDFPDPITVTPTMVQDARYALTILRDGAKVTLNAGAQASLDRLRLALGVLTGTN